MSPEPFDFDGAYGDAYERLARTVIPGYLSSFRQALALLQGRLGPRARLLVVGAGTGIEIVTFKRAEPGWRLTGVDLSAQMLDTAEHRVREAGVEAGVTLIHGTVDDLDAADLGAADLGAAHFDAATCFNVMHFLPDDGAKQALLRGIANRLPPGAPFVLFELHGDRAAPDFDELFAAWSRYWKIQGMGGPERVEFRARIDAGIHWASEARIRELMARAGFKDVRRYFRSLLYGGWIARRAR
ncbi:class I SAM-dependent methyltransferase [Candidatus Palauibacter sp.]|uniref:class I SAM-dependent methyltransferase n=1 Tax=Candidatus Palauibacter sp. TaxID=3101350 RepID=UPI003B02211F